MAITTDEIKEAVEQIKKTMSEVKVHDTIKDLIAGDALVMECCFAAALELIENWPERQAFNLNEVDLARVGIEKDIALALFGTFTTRALMAQTQINSIENSPYLLRGGN